MGFEMMSRSYLAPHKLYAMVCLVNTLKKASRDQLLNLLQPSVLNDKSESQEITERLYRTAIRCGLVHELNDKEKSVELGIPTSSIAKLDSFRRHMQEILLGVTEQSQDHYVLNMLAAWYAVQNENVLGFTRSDINRKFQEQLFPGSTDPVMNENPGVLAWLTWAEFLGWGWSIQFNNVKESKLVPDATVRIQPLFSKLLSSDGREIGFAQFMSIFRSLCPELDGGVLFEQAWAASRGSEQRGNRLSLMLSTALRVLHKQGEIELIYRSDASDIWTLFPTQSYINQVTHIRRKVSV